MTVSLAWIELLFKRFDEIYLDRAKLINCSIPDWTFALKGISGQAIKAALDICKKDTMILPTPVSFSLLCKPIAVNAPVKAAEALTTAVHVIPLQYKEQSLKTTNSVSKNIQREVGWENVLINMSEVSAMNLSTEDKYDRTRLILEQHGRDNVRRNAEYAAMHPIPTNQSAKRKDWG